MWFLARLLVSGFLSINSYSDYNNFRCYRPMTNYPENELLALIQDAANTKAKRSSGALHKADSSNLADSLPFRIIGGGSKDFYGGALRGVPLSTKALQGVVSYEPSELYITALAGTPLKDVESVLAEKGQYLAFESPNFNAHSTIGGVVGCGLSGPSRATCGGVRDYVLGLKMINGRGEQLSFGGQVMKNVAGYDVSRVLCGSLGTLGLITEVSLKVLGLPLAEETLVLQLSQQRAIDTLNAWGATALALNASVWASGSTLSNPSGGAKGSGSGELWVRLRGSRAAVSSGVQTVLGHCERGGILVHTIEHDQVREFWSALKNQELEFFNSTGSSENCLWRLSVPQKTPELIIEGVDPSLPQCLEWNAAQRWLWAPSGLSARIKGAALKAGGHATLWRVSTARAEEDRGVGVFTPLTQAQRTIQKALQREFDPWGLFDTGRLEI